MSVNEFMRYGLALLGLMCLATGLVHFYMLFYGVVGLKLGLIGGFMGLVMSAFILGGANS